MRDLKTINAEAADVQGQIDKLRVRLRALAREREQHSEAQEIENGIRRLQDKAAQKGVVLQAKGIASAESVKGMG